MALDDSHKKQRRNIVFWPEPKAACEKCCGDTQSWFEDCRSEGPSSQIEFQNIDSVTYVAVADEDGRIEKIRKWNKNKK